MTLAEAKRLYIGAGGPKDHTKVEWRAIQSEMQTIVEAPTARIGARAVAWWGCWSRKLSATGFARQVRKLHAQGKT